MKKKCRNNTIIVSFGVMERLCLGWGKWSVCWGGWRHSNFFFFKLGGDYGCVQLKKKLLSYSFILYCLTYLFHFIIKVLNPKNKDETK